MQHELQMLPLEFPKSKGKIAGNVLSTRDVQVTKLVAAVTVSVSHDTAAALGALLHTNHCDERP